MGWKQPIPVDLEHDFAGDKKLFMFFVLLLLKACRSSQKIWTKKGLLELHRGQVLFSRTVFASYLGMSPSWCRDKCHELAGKYQKIDLRLTHQGHVIYIRDYETLTAFDTPDCHQSGCGMSDDGQSIATNKKTVQRDKIVQKSSYDASIDTDTDFEINSKEENLLIKPKKSHADPAIDELISLVKGAVQQYGFLYKPTRFERFRAKDILYHAPFGEFSERIDLARKDSALRVLHQSMKHEFWRGKITTCEAIYKHYAKVYNDFVRDVGVGDTDLSLFVV